MELQDVAGRDDIATLARYTDDPAQKAALDELTGDDDTSRQRYREQPNRSLIDLLRRFPDRDPRTRRWTTRRQYSGATVRPLRRDRLDCLVHEFVQVA